MSKYDNNNNNNRILTQGIETSAPGSQTIKNPVLSKSSSRPSSVSGTSLVTAKEDHSDEDPRERAISYQHVPKGSHVIPDDDILRLFHAPSKQKQNDVSSNPATDAPRREVIFFDEIKNDFERDPEEALRNTIPLTHDPDALIRKNGPQIDSIRERMKKEERIKDILHDDPMFRLAKLIQGRVGPQMHSKVANFNLDDITGNQELFQTVLGQSGSSIFSEGDNIASLPPPAKETAARAKRRISSIFDTEVNDSPYKTRVAQTQYLEKIMHTSAVNGMSIMSDLTMSMVAQALGALRSLNYDEYNGKTMHDFIKDEQTMVLFADVVVSFFNIGMVEHSVRYVARFVMPSKMAAMHKKCVDLYTQTVYDRQFGGFRRATTQESKMKAEKYLASIKAQYM